jgi:hypothetical protein
MKEVGRMRRDEGRKDVDDESTLAASLRGYYPKQSGKIKMMDCFTPFAMAEAILSSFPVIQHTSYIITPNSYPILPNS